MIPALCPSLDFSHLCKEGSTSGHTHRSAVCPAAEETQSDLRKRPPCGKQRLLFLKSGRQRVCQHFSLSQPGKLSI